MGTQIPGIPQTATGVSLTNHINDRLRRISLALDGAAGTPGATGATGAPGTSGGAVSTAVTRRGKAVMFGARAASQTFSDFAGNHLSIDMNGAVADCLTVTDAAMSASSDPTHLGSASAGFTVLNIGMPVLVVGAGASGAGLQGTIVSISSPAVAVLSVSCLTTVTGAEATWGTDNTAAVNAVVATAAAINADVLFPPGTWLITGTITLYPHTRIHGTWGGTPHDGLNDAGSTLFYAGPPNTVIVSALGVAGLVWEGVSVNGGNNAISGVTCVLYDSGPLNVPQSNRTVIQTSSFYNAGLITYQTLRGTTNVIQSIDGTGLQLGNSGVLAYQSDTITIRDCFIFLTRSGIAFNSYNAAQNCSISGGAIFSCQECLDFTLSPGTVVVSCVAFSLLPIPGTACNVLNCATLLGPVTVLGCESEGGYGRFLYLPATNGANPTVTLIGNTPGHASVVGDQSSVVSIANTYSGRDFVGNPSGCQISTTADSFLNVAPPLPYSAGTAEVTSGSVTVLFDPVTIGFSVAPLDCSLFDRGTISFEGQAVTGATNASPPVFAVAASPSSGPVFITGGTGYWRYANGWQVITKLTTGTFGIVGLNSTSWGPAPATLFVCTDPYILAGDSNESGTIAKIVGYSTTQLVPTASFAAGYAVVTTQGSLGFSFGDLVRLIDDSTNGQVYINGTVLSYAGTTLEIGITDMTLGDAAIGTFPSLPTSAWSVVRVATGFVGSTNLTQAYYITSVPPRAFVGFYPPSYANYSPNSLSLPGIATLATQQILTNKTIPAWSGGAVLDDGLGNLPGTWPSQVYSSYVSSISTFPGSHIGWVTGAQLSALSLFGYQIFYDESVPGNLWFRYATSATAWGTWTTLITNTLVRVNDDSAGNLPATWPVNQTYTLFVNAISTFPGTKSGIVSGVSLVAQGIYGFQTYYDGGGSPVYARQATSATAWGSWTQLPGGGTLPASAGGTGVTSIAALFALMTAAEVETALTFTPAAAFTGFTGTLASAITAGKNVVNGIIQP